MTRPDAINCLALLLAGAPNHADYVAWLWARTNDELAALVHEPIGQDPISGS